MKLVYIAILLYGVLIGSITRQILFDLKYNNIKKFYREVLQCERVQLNKQKHYTIN